MHVPRKSGRNWIYIYYRKLEAESALVSAEPAESALIMLDKLMSRVLPTCCLICAMQKYIWGSAVVFYLRNNEWHRLNQRLEATKTFLRHSELMLRVQSTLPIIFELGIAINCIRPVHVSDTCGNEPNWAILHFERYGSIPDLSDIAHLQDAKGVTGAVEYHMVSACVSL